MGAVQPSFSKLEPIDCRRQSAMVHLKKTLRRALKLAHDVRHVTLNEPAQLPNLLGRITPAMLRTHGYYARSHRGSDAEEIDHARVILEGSSKVVPAAGTSANAERPGVVGEVTGVVGVSSASDAPFGS